MFRVAFAFLVGLSLGWAFLPTPLTVCGWYNDALAPAWVQGVGSVLAIFVAIGIAWRQYNEQQRQATLARERDKAEIAQRWITDRRLFIDRLRNLGTQVNHIGSLHFNAIRNPAAVLGYVLNGSSLTGAYGIKEMDPHLHFFPEVARTIAIQLLQKIDQYVELHSRLYGTDEAIAKYYSMWGGALYTLTEEIGQLAFSTANALELESEGLA
jgi:hypothetical protein